MQAVAGDADEDHKCLEQPKDMESNENLWRGIGIFGRRCGKVALTGKCAHDHE